MTGLVLYLGNLTEINVQAGDLYLVKILLVASRKAITRAWYRVDPPTKEQWLSAVEEIYDMERFTFILRVQGGKPDSRWLKLIEYKRKEQM